MLTKWSYKNLRIFDIISYNIQMNRLASFHDNMRGEENAREKRKHVRSSQKVFGEGQKPKI